MKLKTIGFDFDQTLADSAPGIASCLRAVCDKFNLEINQSEIETFSKSGLMLETILQELFKVQEINPQKEFFMNLYPTIGVTGTTIMPGSKELIESLIDEGNHLVLISAKSQRNLELSLQHLGFQFQRVYGDVSGQNKAKVMIENEVNIYIGDQLSDIQAANLANATAILVNKVYDEDHYKYYPHMYFKNLFELKESISSI